VSAAVIQQLHDSPWQGVFHVTGGGVTLLSQLLGVSGASRTVLEATVPYASAALDQLLGQKPEQAASAATARALAMAAYQRARTLTDATCFGLGCSASLVTDRSKRGQTRAHWAVQTATASWDFYLELDATRQRHEQEAELCNRLVESLASTLLDQPWSGPGMAVCRPDPAWHDLLNDAPYRWCTGDHPGDLILPGSFNPVHEGHYQMLQVAQDICGKVGAFELTLRNADKPDLDYLSVQERLTLMQNHQVWLTNQANFAAKAELFPGATFVLGTDTLVRIGQPRFYGDSEQVRDQAIHRLRDLDIDFLVLGRLDGQQFIGLEDLTLPKPLRDLCRGVPESVYRNDASSTQIRQGQSQPTQ
jgi:nicotinamide mononucleotide (NMN) deamidase PncC